MTDSYGTMAPSAGDQRDRLAALLMERQMGGPVGAPQPGVPTPSAMAPVPGQASAGPSTAPGAAPAMPGTAPVAGAMPPPGAGAMPAAPPLPGVTPGGGQPGQPLPLRY